MGTTCGAVDADAQPLADGLNEVGLKLVVLDGCLVLRRPLSASDASIPPNSAPADPEPSSPVNPN